MKSVIKKLKGKKALSVLLVLIMVLTVASPAFSSMLGINAYAAGNFTVELAFDNLFVFDHWVTNGNSMIIDNDYGSVNAGTITDIDLENGSFKFNNNTNHNIYTRAAAGTGDKTEENFDYYRMPVEEGATYTFSCNFTGTSPAFYPHVFFYTESNEFTGNLINGAFSGEGDYAFNFTVPAGAKYIQLRLAIAGNDAKNAYAVIKDICVSRYSFEIDSTNLFVFDSWASNSNSNSLATGFGYDDGTVTADPNTDTITMVTNTGSSTSGNLFTNFSFSSNSGYYSIDVEPNTTYTLSYNIADGSNALHFCPYIVRNKADGSFIDYIGEKALAYGVSNFTFTTTAETEYISVVFSIEHQNQDWTLILKDIGVYETYITDYKVDPVRETYTYNSSNTATYGTLPTPPAETYPEGYIFAGWYTGKDGTGTRIASDTKILPQSMTVYPKFEPAVSSLTVKTSPTKTTYTVGEKINIAGLVLTATIDDGTGAEGSVNTFDISSGFYIDPEYAQDTAGTQTITVHYGGKTATFPITVSAGYDKDIIVNGNTHAGTVANNNYIINYQATAPFNRYEMTYSSDSYVKGEIVMDGVTEEFFLEPSGNGSFASYIDSFLRGVSHYNVDSIKFTCLDNELGNFELLSLTTIAAPIPSNPTQYYENTETGYKVGVDLSFGGVVSEIYDLNNTGKIESRVYNIDGKNVTKVDYASILDKDYGTNYISKETGNINLINKFDRGRYLQQSYYGTSQKPYELGDYNGQEWPYNPVQGGNLVINNADGTTKGNEASKVIDFRITDKQIYVKTRPLDWGKNSVDYPDSYVTDSYMEAWYVFEDGMIKTYCRFVDFSGYPSHTRDQELPAVYIIEPLNHFVYNDVADGSQWTTTNYKKTEEPDFWGVLPEYNALLVKDGQATVDPTVDCYENWAAFAASNDASSFGVGVYSAGVTDFHYGCFYPKYNETEAKNGNLVLTENRHAVTTTPAEENPTSYISPVDSMTFESYTPIEYSYYITTGTAQEIHDDFKSVAQKDNQAELDKSKIAVPETAYMTPANGASTVGQYYVNNIMDENNNYNIKTEAARDAGMYLGLHVKDAKQFSVKITNVTPDKGGDIYLCNTSGSEISESKRIDFGAAGTFENDTQYGLRFSGTGLQPGEKTTAKWEITVYFEDGSTETYTAYTVMYAPGRTVGAVAEARQVAASQHEISSWITGANGVDHSKKAPLGSLHGDYKGAGSFTQDPLVYDSAPSSGSGGDATDYIDEVITGADVDNNVYNENTYVMQTATNDHDSSRAQSYLGLLTVDKSRYTNTNQIPNLKIGYDVLRIGSYVKNSLGKYTTYYTLGTESAYTATDLSAAPSGWTTYSGPYTDFADSHTLPYRESFVPSFAVSDIDGKYIHALNQGVADQNLNPNQYATAGTSVLCSVTDKSGLRESVLTGYGVTNTNPEFDEALENAATILGDPSATQEEIDNAKTDLDKTLEEIVDIYYALKYDNLFSAYEFSQKANSMAVVADRGTVTYNSGTLTVKNETITGGEAYTNYGSGNDYYKVDLKPNTEYVFEYDVETTLKAQAFMFFYNSSGGAGDVPTNMSVKVDDGNWSAKSESNPWWGNYTNDAGTKHYAIKFTTGANTTQASFRFGNTSNDPVTSTFSNIKLVDAAHYYEDVVYTKTEDTYKEYTSYGTLPTLTRTGYTFKGWSDVNNTGITGATIATEHRTIYSQWNENTYNIVYDANGGSGTTSLNAVPYSKNVTLPSSGFTKTDYKLIGWSTSSDATSADYQPGQTVSGLTAEDGKTVTLYAVWAKSEVNVTFDNLIDISEWEKLTPGNASATFTDTAITLTSKEGAGEGTFESHEFPVTAGKEYKIDIDFEGTDWDVYIFFRNETTGGTGINFADSTNRFSSSGAGNQTRVFTAPEGATKAVIRLDANNSNNTVKFSNIRVWENTGITVSPVNKIVGSDQEYGKLPTPVREGYKFDGWKNANGDWILESYIVNSDKTVNLYSQWTELEYGINFSTNGGTGDCPTKNVKHSEEFTTYDGLTATGATFLGWSTNQYATTPDFAGGANVNVSQLQEKGIQGDTLYAVWELNDDAVVDDTVVTDFGLAMTISPYGNDTGIFIYHALEFSDNGYTIGFSTDNGKTINSTATGTYGDFSVDGTNIIYTPTKVALGVEEITLYTKITYRDGSVKVVSNTIKMVPATNVLFEENYLVNGKSGAVEWTTDGTATNSQQSLADNVNDTYGYDSIYATSTHSHSNGSAAKATVSSTAKRSTTKTTTLVGTGFDLMSACGPNTGIVIIKVSGGDLANAKSYIIDTYYDGELVNDNGIICQTPIVSFAGGYGTYTIEATAAYLSTAKALQSKNVIGSTTLANGKLSASTGVPVNDAEITAMLTDLGLEDIACTDIELVWFDNNSILNGGTGAKGNVKTNRAGETTKALECYLDGFRVYNPLGSDYSAYKEAEKNATYINVINALEKNNIGSSTTTTIDTLAYITGTITDGKLSFEDYQNVGPQNELYLNPNADGALMLMLGNVSDTSRVMLGLRAVTGTATVKIGSGDKARSFEINSATEMYYDITECITDSNGDATITIQNSGSGILAVNNIKITGDVTATSMVGEEALEYVAVAMAAPVQEAEVINGVVTDVVEDDTTIPDTDDDTATPDDGDDTTGDDTTTGGSFIEQLIAMIIELIKSIFTILPAGEVM